VEPLHPAGETDSLLGQSPLVHAIAFARHARSRQTARGTTLANANRDADRTSPLTGALAGEENPYRASRKLGGDRRVWHRALRDWPKGRVTARLRFVIARISRCSGGLCSCSAADRAAAGID
jgi:hypothetical protein